jgi:hypothetical protein
MNESILKTFFLCEDAGALERALKLKDTIVANCGDQVLIEASFCVFARLCHPRLKEIATDQIAGADMLIVSTSNKFGLPFFVQNWLAEAVPQKARIACTVYIRDELAGPPDDQFLQKWSNENGATFFSNCVPETNFNRAGLNQVAGLK